MEVQPQSSLDAKVSLSAAGEPGEQDCPDSSFSTSRSFQGNDINDAGVVTPNPALFFGDYPHTSLDTSPTNNLPTGIDTDSGNAAKIPPPNPSDLRDLAFEELMILLPPALHSDVKHSIATWMAQYLGKVPLPHSELRTSILPSLTAEYDYWPVLEWETGEDIEVRGLFHVDESGCCNCLLHYASGKRSTSAGKEWFQKSMEWRFNSRSSLKSLVLATQHQLERIRLSSSKTITQISDESSPGASDRKYITAKYSIQESKTNDELVGGTVQKPCSLTVWELKILRKISMRFILIFRAKANSHV